MSNDNDCDIDSFDAVVHALNGTVTNQSPAQLALSNLLMILFSDILNFVIRTMKNISSTFCQFSEVILPSILERF